MKKLTREQKKERSERRKKVGKQIKEHKKELSRLNRLHDDLRPKMKPGGGRAKGSGFERRVAKMVTDAFREFGITDKDCYRTPLSGGHIHAKGYDPGDLVLSPKLKKMFPFVVECKNVEGSEMYRFLMPYSKWQKSWQEYQWLQQVKKSVESVEEEENIPLLVFKKNQSPIFCALPECLPTTGKFNGANRLKFNVGDSWWFVVPFEKFLKAQVKVVRENEK